MTPQERKTLGDWLRDFEDPSIIHDTKNAPVLAVFVRRALDGPVEGIKSQAEVAIDRLAREDNTRLREQLAELQGAAAAVVEKSREVATNVTMLEGTAFDTLRHVLVRQGVKVSRSPK